VTLLFILDEKRCNIVKLSEQKNLIDWATQLLLLIEDWFHRIQAWLMGEDTDSTWPGRLVVSDSDAAEAYEQNG
jgi:hypothetical protein